MLTKESFNAFLKTLEEPPEHTIFVFATTDIHKVPLTIISRCQRFDFRRIQMNIIVETLIKIASAEKIKIDNKTLAIIAKKADGALRDAESYFDQVVSFCGDKIDSKTVAQMLNLIEDEIYFTISDAILNKNFKAVYDVSNKIYENGWDFLDFLDGLTEHFRNILTVILTENTSLIEAADLYSDQYLDYIGKLSKGDLLRALSYLSKVQQELRFSQNQKLKIEIALSHLIGLEKSSTMTELISEINTTNTVKKNLNEPDGKTYSAKSDEFKKSPGKKEQLKTKEPEKSSLYKKPESTLKTSKIIEQNGEPGLDTITKKWEHFISQISDEKGLTLGPAITSLNLLSLTGNDLSVSSDLSDIRKTIEINKKYLETKTELIFGRRLHIRLRSNSEPPIIPLKQSAKNSLQTTDKKEPELEDPYEDVIINELGGVKIN
jgi:DNA polymerase-3 subunit gamma/tau